MWRRRVHCALVLTILGGLVIPPGPAAAAGGTLDSPDSTLSWAGTFQDVALVSDPRLYATPGVCPMLACQEFGLDVELPASVWDHGPGGVQIAIDWSPNEENDLDLYVYGPDGRLAGRSDGMMASTGEAVRLSRATNGRYRIVVVPRLVRGSMPYHGLVSVERDPSKDPLRPLLPNLVSLPPPHVELRTGAYFADHQVDGTPSCYPDEVVEQGARRCLRFDQVIANLGEGPFELHYEMSGLATDQPVRQRVYSSDGSFQDYDVDRYEFHPAHAHFHYKSFGQAFLYRRGANGGLEKVRESHKNGFCMIDVENVRFERPPAPEPGRQAAPRRYYFPRCNLPGQQEDKTATALVNGISPGWADVYNWFLADQYIEISGLPDGDYILETVANPARTVHETSVDDNTARIALRLQGDSVAIIP